MEEEKNVALSDEEETLNSDDKVVAVPDDSTSDQKPVTWKDLVSIVRYALYDIFVHCARIDRVLWTYYVRPVNN